MGDDLIWRLRVLAVIATLGIAALWTIQAMTVLLTGATAEPQFRWPDDAVVAKVPVVVIG